MDTEILDILQRLHNLEDEIVGLGLKGGQTREPSTSLVDEFEIFGRGSEKDEIINFLRGNDTAYDRQAELSKWESSISISPEKRFLTTFESPIKFPKQKSPEREYPIRENRFKLLKRNLFDPSCPNTNLFYLSCPTLNVFYLSC